MILTFHRNFDENPLSKQDSLGLYCLTMSHKRDDRLKWVKLMFHPVIRIDQVDVIMFECCVLQMDIL